MTGPTLRPCVCSAPERVVDGALCLSCGGVIPLASPKLVVVGDAGAAVLPPWWNEDLTASFGLDTGRLKGCLRAAVVLLAAVAIAWWLR